MDSESNARIYHVEHDGKESKVTNAISLAQHRHVIRDLGIRASDLVQTNGIIWVEGPSDRTFIKKWLKLAGSTFIDGVHYSIMFYGGALLAHVAFEDIEPPFTDEFIELLKINRHAFVVIDSDLTPGKTKLREYKSRVKAEIGEDRCWITKGKEIENYLRPELIKSYLEEKLQKEVRAVKFGDGEQLDKAMKRAAKPTRVAYSKVRDSPQLADKMTVDDLNQLDLKRWIGRILDAIKQWNSN